MVKFENPFKTTQTSVLFVNGCIHLLMFILFLVMYIINNRTTYLYVFIIFVLSSLSLIFSSIIKCESINNQN